MDWDICQHGNSCYMKGRLGYHKGREDYCFNGFAFGDLLHKNDYFRMLLRAPEFISQISNSLECPEVETDYMNQSKYYCYEYKVPIDRVMFDDHDDYSKTEKKIYLLDCVFERLSQYERSETEYMYDHDNPILRLHDSDTMPPEMCICKKLMKTGI